MAGVRGHDGEMLNNWSGGAPVAYGNCYRDQAIVFLTYGNDARTRVRAGAALAGREEEAARLYDCRQSPDPGYADLVQETRDILADGGDLENLVTGASPGHVERTLNMLLTEAATAARRAQDDFSRARAALLWRCQLSR